MRKILLRPQDMGRIEAALDQLRRAQHEAGNTVLVDKLSETLERIQAQWNDDKQYVPTPDSIANDHRFTRGD